MDTTEEREKNPATSIVGHGMRFEHIKRMCCRFVDTVEKLPLKAMRSEVLDRVVHDVDTTRK